MMHSPIITGIRQLCIVTHDLEATVKSYVEDAGIGPWGITTYAPPKLTNTKIRGVPQAFTMRNAVAFTGDFMWEIVQPLDGPTPYKDFLERKGEGAQHILIRHEGHTFDEVVDHFRSIGCPPAMEGTFMGSDFAYIDAEGPLKLQLEVVKYREGFTRPAPDVWYPAAP